jgi:hypothetical protein
MKKIIFVCFNGDAPTSGFATRVNNLVHQVYGMGCVVSVVRFFPVFRGSVTWSNVFNNIDIKLIEVPVFPISRSRYLRSLSLNFSIKILNYIIGSIKPDIVQAECHEAAAIVCASNFKGVVYVDVHGAGPEEAYLSRKIRGALDFSMVDWMNEAETRFIDRADKLIVVTNNMVEHLERKHNKIIERKTKILPIFVEDYFLSRIEKNKARKNLNFGDEIIFIYSGGVQVYQCLEKTIDFFAKIKKFIPSARLMILTPSVSVVSEKINSLDPSVFESIYLRSCTKEELPDFISAADFGFVIRDKDVINYVAAPTKCVEYMARGVRVICTDFSGNAVYYVNKFNYGVSISPELNDSDLSRVINYVEQKFEFDENVVFNIRKVISREEFNSAIKSLYH